MGARAPPTTISPTCATRLAALHTAHGSHYVAAPVLGRPDAAAAGQLVTFLAGDAAAIERATPVIRAYAPTQITLGSEPRVANSLKLAMNYVIVSMIELFGQVFAFTDRGGIDPQIVGMLLDRLLTSHAVSGYATRVRSRDFEPAGFALSAGLKDVLLMLDASTDTRVALPYASVIRDKLLAAIANGLADKDWSAFAEITRMNAGLR